MKHSKEEIDCIETEAEVGYALANRIGQGWCLHSFDPGFTFLSVIKGERDDSQRLSSWAVLDLLKAFEIPVSICKNHCRSIYHLGIVCPVCNKRQI